MILYALPTAKEDVLKVATPLLFKVPVPSVVGPSLKVTVPPAIPAPGVVVATVAVKVTDCPKTEGVPEVISAVVVLALFTTWLTGELVLVRKLESPA